MHRYAAGVLCSICVFLSLSYGQTSDIEPVHFAAGTVLTFHMQTRLKPSSGNEMDSVPKGTVLHVKMLDSIDSRVDRDGTPFRGSVVAAVVSGDETVVHSEAEVHGLLALLRSRNHPEGFRFELMLTGVTDHGKTYDLTASLSPSLFESTGSPASVPTSPDSADKPKESLPESRKLPEPASVN
jgi:hypothetical protein